MKLDELIIKNVSLDLDLLLKEGLSPTSYIWLYLLYKNDMRCYNEFHLNQKLLENLENRNYIKSISDNKYKLDNKGLDLFEESNIENKFLEFWELYPKEVPDGMGGIRILRTGSSKSKQSDICRDKYFRIIKNKPELHNHIIKCLKKQLEMEANKIKYMTGIEVWLNNHTWEKYEDLENNKTDYAETI